MATDADAQACILGSIRTGVETTEFKMNGARTPTRKTRAAAGGFLGGRHSSLSIPHRCNPPHSPMTWNSFPNFKHKRGKLKRFYNT